MADPIIVTAKYGTIITAIGKAKITAAILAGEKVNITHAAVGDGGGAYYQPTDDQVDLVRECWRGEIASMSINKTAVNMIDVKFVIPADVGGFTIREGKLVDDEDDTIAIWNTPDIQKIVVDDGATFPLTMLAHIVVEDANAVTVTVNPSLDTVSREEMEEALRAYADGVGSAIIKDIEIPVDAWVSYSSAEPGFKKYHYIADIAIDGCTEKHFPTMAFSIQSEDPVADAEVSATSETIDGYVRFWCVYLPTETLVGTIQLRAENLIEISGDIASGDEVDDTLDNAFGEGSAVIPGATIATPEQVMEVLDKELPIPT